MDRESYSLLHMEVYSLISTPQYLVVRLHVNIIFLDEGVLEYHFQYADIGYDDYYLKN